LPRPKLLDSSDTTTNSMKTTKTLNSGLIKKSTSPTKQEIQEMISNHHGHNLTMIFKRSLLHQKTLVISISKAILMKRLSMRKIDKHQVLYNMYQMKDIFKQELNSELDSCHKSLLLKLLIKKLLDDQRIIHTFNTKTQLQQLDQVISKDGLTQDLSTKISITAMNSDKINMFSVTKTII